uniref:F-box domain-containing protein n=1 Tax=Ditylenchus dipsaci TaxID=166011 RepID=A0A915CV10_9BILA
MLPSEILYDVANFLPISSKYNLMCISSRFNQILNSSIPESIRLVNNIMSDDTLNNTERAFKARQIDQSGKTNVLELLLSQLGEPELLEVINGNQNANYLYQMVKLLSDRFSDSLD